ncbi:MAG: hypothetical protein ACI3WR_01020 [Oscillospiraceae bacterium]
MARRILLSLTAAAASAGAYWLRLQQLLTAFEPETGLPLPASRWSCYLWGLLGALLLLSFLLLLPEKGAPRLFGGRRVLFGTVLQSAGALLLAAGAAWQLYLQYPALKSAEALLAALLLLSALALFAGVAGCLGREGTGPLLLLPMCCAVLQLLAAYRSSAAEPTMLYYDMRILAFAAAAVAAMGLCGLAFGAGGRRVFLLSAAMTPALCAAALADGVSMPRALGLMGCALAAYGFFLAVLFGLPVEKRPAYELVEDPFSTGPVPVRPSAPEPAPPAFTPEPEEETPAPWPAPTPEPPAPAPAPPAPAEDDFDLARVDRLLEELEREKRQK